MSHAPLADGDMTSWLTELSGDDEVFHRFGKRWTLAVTGIIEQGSLRFVEIQRRLPRISRKVLAQTLHELERDGFVGRVLLDAESSTTVYSLTPLGHTLFAPLRTLRQWARDNAEAIEAAHRCYDSLRARKSQ